MAGRRKRDGIPFVAHPLQITAVNLYQYNSNSCLIYWVRRLCQAAGNGMEPTDESGMVILQ